MLTERVVREAVVQGAADRLLTWMESPRSDLSHICIPLSGDDSSAAQRHTMDLYLRFVETDRTRKSLLCIFGGSADSRRLLGYCDITLRPMRDDQSAIVVSTQLRDSSRDADGSSHHLAEAVLDTVVRVADHQAAQDAAAPALEGRMDRPAFGTNSVAGPREDSDLPNPLATRVLAFVVAFAATREFLRWRDR